MRYFSMFSGIGGFELGIQQAYEAIRNLNVQAIRGGETIKASELQEVGKGLHPISSETALLTTDWDNEHSDRSFDEGQPDCIGYSEIDKYAIQIYERHFKHKNYGDATTINASELPDFDLLVGGFPCQAFSIAGKRGGLDDARGTLFYDIARIVKEKRPQHLLLENVKGLLSHDNGGTFKLIISTFAELGYNLEWQVLNSKNFGVPQNRERVFIIGHLGRCCGRQVFPLSNSDTETIELQGQQGITNTLTTRYTATGSGAYIGERKFDAQINQLNQPIHSNDRVYGADGISPTLNTMQGGNRQPFVAPVLTPDRPNKRQNGRRFKESGEPSFTLTSQDKHSIYDGMRIRRLTPTECERLQAYPDGWTEGVSDTQRYKTLGNGVTVSVVREIMTRLYDNDRHDN